MTKKILKVLVYHSTSTKFFNKELNVIITLFNDLYKQNPQYDKLVLVDGGYRIHVYGFREETEEEYRERLNKELAKVEAKQKREEEKNRKYLEKKKKEEEKLREERKKLYLALKKEFE